MNLVLLLLLLTVRVHHIEGWAVLGEADSEESVRRHQQHQQRTEQKHGPLTHGCSRSTRPVHTDRDVTCQHGGRTLQLNTKHLWSHC